MKVGRAAALGRVRAEFPVGVEHCWCGSPACVYVQGNIGRRKREFSGEGVFVYTYCCYLFLGFVLFRLFLIFSFDIFALFLLVVLVGCDESNGVVSDDSHGCCCSRLCRSVAALIFVVLLCFCQD